jgi:hypothetical protein
VVVEVCKYIMSVCVPAPVSSWGQRFAAAQIGLVTRLTRVRAGAVDSVCVGIF